MKNVLILALALFSATSPIAQAEGPTLREHMVSMSVILDEVWVLAANPSRYARAADKVAELRGHLIDAIKMTPSKVANLEGEEKRLAQIDFQQFMARVIYLTASLESTLIQPDLQSVSQSREQDIENLLKEISVTVGRAHGKFR